MDVLPESGQERHRDGTTSTGLIYQYFVDKQDIFAALLSVSQLEWRTS
ncbi:hypothetical protein LQL77_27765 [Rhodococcus cerastii]|nr:hypothetical protein [Rhodococcus cerastii]